MRFLKTLYMTLFWGVPYIIKKDGKITIHGLKCSWIAAKIYSKYKKRKPK